MIPSEWKEYHLIDCAIGDPEYGANSSSIDYDPNLPRYIRITDIIESGRLDNTKKASIVLSGNERYVLREGDFLFARSGATVGKTFLYRGSLGKAIFAGYLIRFRLNTKILLPEYLEQFTQTRQYWAWVQNTIHAGAQPNINAQEFASLPIAVPPKSEQHAIIRLLCHWDRAIDLTAQLIAAKQQRKRGLMQELLTGRRRFPEFSESWQTLRIGDFLSESRLNGSNGRTARKITVKLYGRGVVPKEERNTGSTATKYYQRRAGQFIYSKLDFLNGAFGIIPLEIDGYESTLDLPCFDFKGDVLPQFFLYFVSRECFYSQFVGAALGGRKARRIQVEEFLAFEIEIPTLEEQERIVALLSNCDRELNLLDRKLELLKKQKQGLMQQLLTGKVRVK